MDVACLYVLKMMMKKLRYLKKVLEINPQNEKVIAALKKLEPHILNRIFKKAISNSQKL